jgi:hypothetical protein
VIDANALVRKWLVTGLPSDRVWVAVLPAYDEHTESGFRPDDGPGIVLGVAGGGLEADIPILDVRIQVTVYAGPDEGLAAGTLSGQIRDLLHDKRRVDLSPTGYVISSLEDSDSQIGAEPTLGYAMAVSFYRMILRSN